mmetsp:Transcript_39745/g.88335  ORF Transcript_39745/g.88335 Transcript_39745/m.88335 type:complete len:257 (+) Transcript_39745:73-843(+)
MSHNAESYNTHMESPRAWLEGPDEAASEVAPGRESKPQSESGASQTAHPHAITSRPGPQILGTSKRATPNFGSDAFSEEIAAETQREKYQQHIISSVKKDIKKMLHASKPFMQHVRKPVVMSRATLENLSAPKPQLVHPENQLGYKDPIEYARFKAHTLEQQRLRQEAVMQKHEEEQVVKQQNLQAYTTWKQQLEQVRRNRQEQHEGEMREYGREVSKYLKSKAETDLLQYRARRERDRERANKLHAEMQGQNFRW